MSDATVVRPGPQRGQLAPVTRFRLLTSRFRVLPDFLIIGGMRCGTTSLYAYLRQHPQTLLPWTKEVHYIDRAYARGTAWYRANFPTRTAMLWHKVTHGGTALAYEATPAYLVHPDGPRRLAKIVPRAKLIALLRDPADRAYSHYHFNLRIERERHAFDKAIKNEAKRLAGETEKLLSDEQYRSRKHHRYSYVARGMYLQQLQAYARYFRREQILVVKSEDLFEKTQGTFDQVLEFLGLESWQLPSVEPLNVGQYPAERAPGYEELREFFAPHNQRLYEYLGRDLGW